MRKRTHDEFINIVFNICGNEYTVLSMYVDAHTKILIRHNNLSCGNCEFEISPANFLSGTRCAKCAKNKKKNTEEFKNEVFDLVGNEYSVLGEYINANTKIKMKHNICGNEYEVRPNHFTTSNSRCPICAYEIVAASLKKSHEEFVQEIFNLVGNEYIVLGQYINSQTKIKLKHQDCGTIYDVNPQNFIFLGRRCPICAESKGEKQVRKYLLKNNIKFTPQMEFDGLIGTGGGNLSYDFYLEKQNILIEYQGEFHDGTAYQQTKQEFLIQKEHDKRKKEYAELHNIKLLEIWYWNFVDIENILENNLRM